MNNSFKFKHRKQQVELVFEATPVMQFNINQEKLPSIVVFRLKNIETGYYIRSFDVVLSK